jgi:hypothetical protein
MGDKHQKRRAQESSCASEPSEEGAERAFDLWLRRGLHRLYDEVAREPVPAELLDLIATDRTRREK